METIEVEERKKKIEKPIKDSLESLRNPAALLSI